MPLPRPLLLPAPAEPFPGWVNVHEVPGLLGGHLMVLHRSVLLWADTPAAERASLFRQAAASQREPEGEALAPTEELRLAIRELGAMRRAPDRVRTAAVSRACDAVSAWAEKAGYPGSAVAWARAAAAADPANVRAAYRVGTLARRRADYPTAEAWLQHAREMGRRYRDWTAHVLALNALGNLSTQRGDFALARGFLGRALRATRRARGRVEGGRKRLPEMEGEVLHDLLTVAVYEGDFPGAERFAAEAFERMRAGHRRLPVLAHDVAGMWMERGYFGRALPVFEAVLPHIHRPPQERVRALTNLLRAAGAVGREDVFRRHFGEAWSMLETLGPGAAPAASWTSLARGAASLRRWDGAERAALRAAAAAEARREEDQRATIPALLDSIRRHRFAEAPPGLATPAEERTAGSLAAGLVESLNALRAGE